MMKIIAISAAACAFLASAVLPGAALPLPKTGQIMTPNAAIEVAHRGDEEWRRKKNRGGSEGQFRDRDHSGWNDDYRKKRHHSRPSIQFYYNPWPYYGYRYDPYFYGGYPYWDDYYYDNYDYDYRPRMRLSGNKHVKWCKKHYSTYNAKTDKYIGKYGKKYRCNSPYDGH